MTTYACRTARSAWDQTGALFAVAGKRDVLLFEVTAGALVPVAHCPTRFKPTSAAMATCPTSSGENQVLVALGSVAGCYCFHATLGPTRAKAPEPHAMSRADLPARHGPAIALPSLSPLAHIDTLFLNLPVSAVSLSQDAEFLAAASCEGLVEVWHFRGAMADPREWRPCHSDYLTLQLACSKPTDIRCVTLECQAWVRVGAFPSV